MSRSVALLLLLLGAAAVAEAFSGIGTGLGLRSNRLRLHRNAVLCAPAARCPRRQWGSAHVLRMDRLGSAGSFPKPNNEYEQYGGEDDRVSAPVVETLKVGAWSELVFGPFLGGHSHAWSGRNALHLTFSLLPTLCCEFQLIGHCLL